MLIHLRRTAYTVLALGLLAAPVHAGPRAPLPVAVPWTWTVQWDVLVPSSQLAGFSTKLGGKLTGLRNTRFEVGGGKTVQINALVAASSADADAIFAALSRMKPREFLVRRGVVVYEFVGKNEVLPMIREAASLLRQGRTPQPAAPDRNAR